LVILNDFEAFLNANFTINSFILILKFIVFAPAPTAFTKQRDTCHIYFVAFQISYSYIYIFLFHASFLLQNFAHFEVKQSRNEEDKSQPYKTFYAVFY